jgi:PAS domain S-box-containing protein
MTNSLLHWAKRAVAFAAFFSGSIATSCLIGWYLKIPALIQVMPSFAPMQANTAICFLLSALALYFLRAKTTQYLTSIFSTATFALAAATIVQYLFDIDIGIDTLLREPFVITKTSHPGRMAPNTAIGFMILSAAFLLAKTNKSLWCSYTASIMGMLCATLGISSIIGYVLNLEQTYGWGQFTRMSILTAMSFSILSLALTIFLLVYNTKLHKDMRFPVLLAVALLGVVTSIVMWSIAESSEQALLRSNISHDASSRAEVIQRSIESDTLFLRALERFFAGSNEVDRNEFHEFTYPLISKNSSILAVDWSARVLASERSRIEKLMRNDGFSEFTFKELETETTLRPRNKAEIYYPVVYSEPEESNRQALGFDHYSDPRRKVAMDKAALTGEPEATESLRLFRLAETTKDPTDFIITLPTYRKKDANKGHEEKVPSGYLFGIFRLPTLIETAISNTQPVGLNIDFYEKTSDEQFNFRHRMWSRMASETERLNAKRNSGLSELLGEIQEKQEIAVAGKKWLLRFTPTEAYILKHHSTAPIMILLSGLVLTGLLGGYLMVLFRKQHTIELAVAQRTREIRQLNNSLEKRVEERTNKLTQLNEALTSSEEIFRQLSVNAPLGIFRTDARGNCEYVNPAWENLSGLKLDKTLGDDWLKAVHPEDKEKLSTIWQNSTTTGEEGTAEFRFLRPDQTVRWTLATWAPVRSPDRTTLGFVGVNSDITAQKKLERELTEVAETKSQFLANMSHEIRTPLTSIIGFTEALREGNSSPKETNIAIQSISRNAEHLLELLNNVLDLSKFEAGALTSEKLSFSPVETLERIKSMYAARATEKSLTFSIKYGWPLPEKVVADPVHFKQILLNLVSNAIKFTQHGWIDIVVSCDWERKELVVEVSDSGVGVSEDAQRMLFQPFTQGDQSTKRKFGGTGLGLAISRRLAETMGGKLELRSTLGKGSTIQLTLPQPDLDHTKKIYTAFEDKPDEKASKTKQKSFNGKILVADDAEENRLYLSFILEKFGLSPVLAKDGIEAVECASCEKFDLVLMDLHMPRLDGYGAIAALRKKDSNLPIIALTADVTKASLERAQKAGSTAYLPKPFQTNSLVELLERYLSKSTGSITTNTSVYSELLSEDPNAIELIKRFVRSLTERLAELETHIKTKDLEALAAVGHKLQGAAGMYGYTELSELAEEVVKISRNENKENAIKYSVASVEKIKSMVARIEQGVA